LRKAEKPALFSIRIRPNPWPKKGFPLQSLRTHEDKCIYDFPTIHNTLNQGVTLQLPDRRPELYQTFTACFLSCNNLVAQGVCSDLAPRRSAHPILNPAWFHTPSSTLPRAQHILHWIYKELYKLSPALSFSALTAASTFIQWLRSKTPTGIPGSGWVSGAPLALLCPFCPGILAEGRA
jgi:hypothetical protein